MTRESENRTVTMEVSEFSIEAHTMEVSAGHWKIVKQQAYFIQWIYVSIDNY